MMYFNLPASVKTYHAYFPAAKDAKHGGFACHEIFTPTGCGPKISYAPTPEACCARLGIVAYGPSRGFICYPCISV